MGGGGIEMYICLEDLEGVMYMYLEDLEGFEIDVRGERGGGGGGEGGREKAGCELWVWERRMMRI